MSRRRWALARAGALTLGATLVAPVNPLVLLAVPSALMLVAFRRAAPLALAAAGLLLLGAFRGVSSGPGPLWLAERGWALALGGAFVGVTVLRRSWSLTERGVAAVATAAGATGVAGWLRPGLLSELDWWVRRDLTGAALAARRWLPEGVWGPAEGHVLLQARSWQEALYPALLGLSSLASLAVGWYVVQRLAGRAEALGPFREFRFSDHLAWVLAAGLALIAVPDGGVLARLGQNTALFVGGLYLLRGTAVLYYVGSAAARSTLSAALCAAAGVLLYPLALPAALAVGVGDSWLDMRRRLLALLGEPGRDRS